MVFLLYIRDILYEVINWGRAVRVSHLGIDQFVSPF